MSCSTRKQHEQRPWECPSRWEAAHHGGVQREGAGGSTNVGRAAVADVRGPMEVGLCLKCSRCRIMSVRWVGSWGLLGTSKVHSKIQAAKRPAHI